MSDLCRLKWPWRGSCWSWVTYLTEFIVWTFVCLNFPWLKLNSYISCPRPHPRPAELRSQRRGPEIWVPRAPMWCSWSVYWGLRNSDLTYKETESQEQSISCPNSQSYFMKEPTLPESGLGSFQDNRQLLNANVLDPECSSPLRQCDGLNHLYTYVQKAPWKLSRIFHVSEITAPRGFLIWIHR